MIFKLIILLLLIQSCSSTTRSELKNQLIHLQKTKIKTINSKDLNLSLSYAIQYPNSSNIYLTGARTDSLFVFKLNLNDFELEKVLGIPSNFHLEAYAIDESSLNTYLFTGDTLMVFNQNSSLLSKNAFGTLPKGYISNLNPVGFNPIIENNNLFIEYFPNIKKTYKSQLLYRQPLQLKVDLNTLKHDFLKMTYPKEYQSKCYGFKFIPDRIVNSKGEHIFTFPYNDSAYIYDKQGNQVDTRYFGTEQNNNFPFIPYEEIQNLQSEVFNQFNQEISHYAFTQAHTYSNLLTRHFITKENSSNQTQNEIVFYNSDWEYLGNIKTKKILCLFDSEKHGLVQLKIHNENIEIYDYKF
ncbi:protein of unknown function [Lishizhenia tianjinensis]|uniref:TolB-like 6-blade propeller-like n=1 Tax=Lishizhenia tianjinensis TaxID=477690 RepID=A0A1I7APZ6_9FLAO|nr:DUF4221 family protein [Lishizhenia tianjinensis]SFT77021.1 protein of unknown function [Lishizhenia tianjinensis]